MITMTIFAQEKAKSLISQLSETEPKNIRISVEAGGCSGFQYGLSFDNKLENDKEFDFDGFKLFVDPTSLMYLENANIDYSEDISSSGFQINNPAAKSSCGCGKSFSS